MVWELVVAWRRMVPVFSRPPTLVTFWFVVVVTPLTMLVTLSVTVWGVVLQLPATD